jgi:hypothetical protein
MHMLASVFLSLLPARYRKAVARWAGISVGNEGAFISGVTECCLCVFMLIFYYFIFTNQIMAPLPLREFLRAAEDKGETAIHGFGLIIIFLFITSPITLLLFYFIIEGGVRALAALITGEIVPTLPLQLIALTHGLGEKIAVERKLGKRISDEVQRPGPEGFDLLIASCRQKKDWNYRLNTISFDDMLYEVAEQRSSAAPRKYVYLLRRKHEAGLVRVLHHYHPDDVLDRVKEMLSEAKRRLANDLRRWLKKT